MVPPNLGLCFLCDSSITILIHSKCQYSKPSSNVPVIEKKLYFLLSFDPTTYTGLNLNHTLTPRILNSRSARSSLVAASL